MRASRFSLEFDSPKVFNCERLIVATDAYHAEHPGGRDHEAHSFDDGTGSGFVMEGLRGFGFCLKTIIAILNRSSRIAMTPPKEQKFSVVKTQGFVVDHADEMTSEGIYTLVRTRLGAQRATTIMVELEQKNCTSVVYTKSFGSKVRLDIQRVA